MIEQYKFMEISILILGDNEFVKLFRFLKHFHMILDSKSTYDNKNYDLIITDNTHLESITNFEGLVFNICEDISHFSTKKNHANLVFNFKYNTNLIQQFIKNPKWNFYYTSIEKSKVKFIYELFATCQSYNKIQSNEIKFHKIE